MTKSAPENIRSDKILSLRPTAKVYGAFEARSRRPQRDETYYRNNHEPLQELRKLQEEIIIQWIIKQDS